MDFATLWQHTHTIAVVGLSADPSRASHRVAAFLQARGFRVLPVNPRHEQVLGEPCYPSLLDLPEPVDMVDVFRRSEHCPEVAHQAVAIGARCLWLQLGIVSVEARRIAEAAGLAYVEDRCTLIELRRLKG
ncbi:CoA-binding protein [Halomonas salifodinae]|uniref:CoA-binding protein n=1 Tax=Halomonas salifodinae TaxID=438745 RepID=A0ABW2F069_9GAMM